jgi:hypothetical protein
VKNVLAVVVIITTIITMKANVAVEMMNANAKAETVIAKKINKFYL